MGRYVLQPNRVIKKKNYLDLLPDLVLLEIFASLRKEDLVKVSQMGGRFRTLCKSPTLWREWNDRGSLPSRRMVMKICRLGKSNFRNLRKVVFRGSDCLKFDEVWVPRSRPLNKQVFDILRTQSGPLLEELELDRLALDVSGLPITAFPSHLKRLSLGECQMQRIPITWFAQLHTHMPELREIELRWCLWVRTEMLADLAKCPKLEVVKLRRAPDWAVHSLAELVRAGGFPSLKHPWSQATLSLMYPQD